MTRNEGFQKRSFAALCGALAVLVLHAPRALGAEPKLWVAPGEMPLPAWLRSVEITRADEPLYQAPDAAAKRRGAAALGARLPIFGAQRGPGCQGRFWLVGALAWVCEEGAALSQAAPDADGEGALRRTRDGLPYRYYFVGRDGSFGYRALQTAEEGVPDAELLKGFGVALLRVENNAQGTAFGLTSEALWVPMRDLNPVLPVSFHGRELNGSLNVAWVVSKKAHAWRAPEQGKSSGLALDHFRDVDVVEERRVHGHRWFRIGSDAWLSDRDARAPRSPASVPSELRAGERWLDVDVENQVLTAYVGERPVFATLISTGRGARGTSLATPLGTHRLWVKLRTSNMDNLDQASAPENYAIQAVPWVMYFERGYGLHGTFWHREFGNKHSHGCVNLSPLDAERLFAWSSPKLPTGWTAAFPTSYEPGTLVRVR